MRRNLFQAYRQAPWRIQVQWMGRFFVALIALALIAGVYLSVSAETTAVSSAIQNLEETKESLESSIPDARSKLASLTSAVNMQKRASVLGYKLVSADKIVYMVIPGFAGRTPINLSSDQPAGSTFTEPLIKPVYTESLWEWLFQGMIKLRENTGVQAP